ncbi:diacylglycerol/lipid kinase family protein [Pararhodospirillum photometricum]|nr:diacylglycerol kinase family protein [Pararhodospirillum photometricum]
MPAKSLQRFADGVLALTSAPAPQAQPRRVCLIANPAAGQGRGQRVRRAVARLESLGCPVRWALTERPGDATRLAREAVARGDVDVVVAAGGDGTINEVANGLVGSAVALGVIPLGTANVLAIEAGVPRRPEHAAQVIATGRLRPLYLGEVRGSAETPLGGPRRFVMMAGAGFDAHVVDTVDLGLKRRTGALAYAWGAFHRAFRYTFPSCLVSVTTPDGREIEAEASTVVVCNGRHYGGPFVAAPRADISQPTFQVVVLTRPGLINAARYGAWLMLGRLEHLPDVRVIEATRVRIHLQDAEPLQADGDTIAHMPVEIVMTPQPVSLIVPDWAPGNDAGA